MTDIETHIIVPADHPSLAGHFPGHPVVPGVVLLEGVLESLRRSVARPVELVAVVSTKFLQAVGPGVALDVRIKLNDEPNGHIKARFAGSHAGLPVLEGSLLLRTDVEERAP